MTVVDLLIGESEGFSFDATTPGGSVNVKDLGNPSNNLDFVTFENAPLLVQESASPKYVLETDLTLRLTDVGEVPIGYEPTLGRTGIQCELAATNLVDLSEDFTDTSVWTQTNLSVTANQTTSPYSGSSADKIVEDSTAGAVHSVRHGDITITANSTRRFSVFVKASTRSQVLLRVTDSDASHEYTSGVFDLSSATWVTSGAASGSGSTFNERTALTMANGWYRLSLSGDVGSNTVGRPEIRICAGGTDTYDGNGTGSIFVWGAQFENEAVVGQCPTSYIPVLSNVNLCTLSEQFQNTVWARTGIGSVSANATTAPNGTTTADALIEDTSSGLHRVSHSTISTDSATNYTFSCYVKANTRTQTEICVGDQFAADVYLSGIFDLVSGSFVTAGSTVGTATFVSRAATDAGNGWWRVVVTGRLNDTVSRPQVRNAQSGVTNYVGDGASSIYVWGAQLELGTSATTYAIAGSATRELDQIIIDLNNFPFDTEKGTVYMDWSRNVIMPSSSNLTNTVMAISPGDDLSVNHIVFTASDGNLDHELFAEGLERVDTHYFPVATFAPADTRLQSTFAWEEENCDSSLDGGVVRHNEQDQAAAIVMPVGLAELRIGSRPPAAGANSLHGFCYRFVYVPRQVHDDDGNLDTWRYNFVGSAPVDDGTSPSTDTVVAQGWRGGRFISKKQMAAELKEAIDAKADLDEEIKVQRQMAIVEGPFTRQKAQGLKELIMEYGEMIAELEEKERQAEAAAKADRISKYKEAKSRRIAALKSGRFN